MAVVEAIEKVATKSAISVRFVTGGRGALELRGELDAQLGWSDTNTRLRSSTCWNLSSSRLEPALLRAAELGELERPLESARARTAIEPAPAPSLQ